MAVNTPKKKSERFSTLGTSRKQNGQYRVLTLIPAARQVAIAFAAKAKRQSRERRR
jgi:hypothetical protein